MNRTLIAVATATALLGMAETLKDEELDALQKAIDQARERGQ